MSGGPEPTRRALVTGATGFIGQHLATSLAQGGWAVHVVARPTSDRGVTAALAAAGCTVHVHDGSGAGLHATVRAANPDVTWHLATRFIAHHEPGDVDGLIADNVLFGTQLLDALRDQPHRRVVLAGTPWQQHGNAAYSPVSLYAATKQALEDIARFYAEARGYVVVSCLLTDTYGPGDRRRKLMAHLADAVRTGTPLAMTGDGSQYIDFVHVADAVRALCVAGDRASAAAHGTTERWAVRSGQSITVREFVERFGRVRGVTVPVQWNARPPRPREASEPWTAGDVIPGWHPAISLDDGLAAL